MKINPVAIGIVLALAVLAALLQRGSSAAYQPRPLERSSNRFLPELKAATLPPVEIPINTLQDFDGMTKAAIYELRTRAVMQYPQLAPENYSPSKGVFGLIEDGKNWWGLHGIFFLGPGQRSHEGPSEESRFVSNPYLLTGLVEPGAFITRREPPADFSGYPRPVRLIIDPAARRGRVDYDLRSYLQHVKWTGVKNPTSGNISLVAYNARDFGFNYLYPFMSDGTSARLANGKAAQISPIAQFIHTGGSCGKPEGCSNMSPYQDGLALSLPTLPGQILVKLWRERPADRSSIEDFLFIINLS